MLRPSNQMMKTTPALPAQLIATYSAGSNQDFPKLCWLTSAQTSALFVIYLPGAFSAAFIPYKIDGNSACYLNASSLFSGSRWQQVTGNGSHSNFTCRALLRFLKILNSKLKAPLKKSGTGWNFRWKLMGKTSRFSVRLPLILLAVRWIHSRTHTSTTFPPVPFFRRHSESLKEPRIIYRI